MDNQIATHDLDNESTDALPLSSSHPKGLYVCFFTEMWERFSFYGLKALLIFYLTEHFLFSDVQATNIFGNYFALVYAFPILGGLLADKYLGSKRAVTFGAVLLCVGHLGMAFEGTPSYYTDNGELVQSQTLPIFYVSLAFIIVGVGFLKPNISGIVGKLYHVNDPRKDAGFTIFYMGINLGAALAAILCGYVGRVYGWPYGFGLAGIGMLFGLIVFLLGQPLLKGHADAPDLINLKKPIVSVFSIEHIIYLTSLVLVGVVALIVGNHQIVAGILGFTLVAISVWLIWFCINEVSSSVKQKLYAAVSLTMMSTVFFLCFLQSGSSMNLFADRVVNRVVFGMEIPAPILQSLNAIFIIILAPIFAYGWKILVQRKREPSTPIKFALGLAQVGLGFYLLVLGIKFADEQGQVALYWLVLAYLLHTSGELFISPIGLSMITKLSAPRIVGLMLGLWFLGSAIAEYIAAWLAGSAAVPSAEVIEGGISNHQQLQTFALLYSDITWIAISGAVATLLISPMLKRWMHDVH
ncbi:MFS transporter [Parashewanella spongiae]|uniref:MFS transporter n=1 Tax=Parashewanella spongiae TaxID=342950 RepID=A0A3A6UJN0_9GAMM|nr:peptide MFS transporter [Parashewanella spongiae]MCL1078939.1 peptide MFS transporter [Parashewanella spongiae]RJY19366.1 MFS transporter [Parashewanella spongiae]